MPPSGIPRAKHRARVAGNSGEIFKQTPFEAGSFRERQRWYDEIRVADLEDITKLTGCVKPCQYRKYQYIGAGEPVIREPEYFVFSL